MLFVFAILGSTVGEFPEMTGNPVFTGPVEVQRESLFCQGGFYTDFQFECQVQYPQQAADNGARFKVSLTFDGQTDPNNPDTHVVTDGTALTVSFPSSALRGNVGKSVNTSLILETYTVSFCRCLKENKHHICFFSFSYNAYVAYFCMCACRVTRELQKLLFTWKSYNVVIVNFWRKTNSKTGIMHLF